MPEDTILLVIIVVWLLILTTVVLVGFRYLAKLGKTTKGKDLVKVLNKVLEKEKLNTKKLTTLDKELGNLEKNASLHIQKVGLVKFNPFKETGGDHSFSLALLDEQDSGIILTGLHTRERTRLYIKEVNEGLSKFELSKEEEKAISKAKANK